MSDSQTAMHFPLLARKPVQVDFTGGTLSSDGGLLLLAQLDQQLGLTERVAACLNDPRLPERIRHSLRDLIRQRVYQIASGYEDANDAAALRGDPALKVAVGRCPHSDPDLASQPTLSRLEQRVTEDECAAINALLLDQFLKTPRPKPRQIVLDFDPSVDPTHGQQEFAFFNGHYGTYCYLPLFVFARVAGERDQFLVSAELPESHGKETDAVLATLKRLIEGIRQRWPGMRVIFRGDAWFATPAIYDWCEAFRRPLRHRDRRQPGAAPGEPAVAGAGGGGGQGLADCERAAVWGVRVSGGRLDEAPAGGGEGRADGVGAQPALRGGLGSSGQAAPAVPVLRGPRRLREPDQGTQGRDQE
jgi:hypothetical protein